MKHFSNREIIPTGGETFLACARKEAAAKDEVERSPRELSIELQGVVMVTETKKVLAIVALIIAAGVATVEMTRGEAQADPMIVAGGAAGYAGARIDGAFELVVATPLSRSVAITVAEKGDLPPLGCVGPFRANIEAECLDAAAEVEAEPSMIVEARLGSTSILTRVEALTLASVEEASPELHSE